MTRFTALICCLSAAPSLLLGAYSAYGAGILLVKQPVVKIQTPTVRESQPFPFSSDDGSMPKKILCPKPGKHLKLSSDLEGLADSRLSQPQAGVT